jgi:uncharacterized protein YndB with AHSA1/START domain
METHFERDPARDATTPLAVCGGHRMGGSAARAMLASTPRAQHDARQGCSIRVRARYHASPGRIFAAWLDPGVARQWLLATASQPMTIASIDARVGGAFRLADREDAATLDFAGRYVEIVPDRRLVFTLRMARCLVEARVTVTLAPRGTGGSLALVHENLSSDAVRYVEDRWTGILYGLGVTLDSTSRCSTITGSPR